MMLGTDLFGFLVLMYSFALTLANLLGYANSGTGTATISMIATFLIIRDKWRRELANRRPE